VRTQAHHHGEDVHVDGVFVELDEDVVPYEAFRETLSAVLYDAYGDDEQE
jgi:hypothetical protein